ncbi:MAG: murein hydrolase activator EnvC family protein [Gaiellaceae bacterium]
MRRWTAQIVVLVAVLAGGAPAAAMTSGAGHVQRHTRARHARHLQQALLFRWPAQGAVTNPFSSWHKGIDIGSLRSLAITAAFGGRVVHVGYTTGFEGYGQIVDVQVRPGVETLYAHLSAERVHVGELIREGEALGTAGCTGICYGTHLHFEVREYGVAVNPLIFLH